MVEDGSISFADSARFASDIRDLMRACRAATDPRDLLEDCEKLFRLLREKKLELGLPFMPHSNPTETTGRDESDGFVKWLQQSFHTFVSLVFELICSSELHIQRLGLSYLFRIAKLEARIYRSASFPLSVFQVLIARLLQSEGFSTHLQDALVEYYASKFLDVRYYLLVVVGKILREFTNRKTRCTARVPAAESEQKDDQVNCDKEDKEDLINDFSDTEADAPEWYVWTTGEGELSKRLTALLLCMSKSFMCDSEMGALHGKRKLGACPKGECDSDSDGVQEDASDSVSHPKTYIANLGNSKALKVANHRLAYQNAWLTLLLNIEHDKATMQKLLSTVPRTVLPFMSNPLVLAGFFLKAFKDANQLSISISALSGMFYLLTKHRLGNPDVLERAEAVDAASEEAQTAGAHFYQHLYRLITPATFAPRLRVRFLRLLNMALRSDLLPICLVASFIKKCSRVACVVSPAATLCLQALVVSVLQKYLVTCKPLLSLPEHFAARLRVAGDGFDYCAAKIREGKEDLFSSDDEVLDDTTEDNAIFGLVSKSVPNRLKVKRTDICPLTRKEARMSLWEIEILSRHSLKPVKQLREIFDSDIGNPASKRLCVDDFLDVTTGSLLSRELKALEKPSSVPLPAFEASAVPSDVTHLYSACLSIARKGVNAETHTPCC